MKHSQYCKVHNGMYCDCGVVEDERDNLLERVKYLEGELKTSSDILIILKPAHDKLAEQRDKMLAELKFVLLHSHEYADGDSTCKCPLCKLGKRIKPIVAEIER